MLGRPREILAMLLVLLVALAVFLPGVDWGLPSRAVDPYLFGNRPVWSGAKILALSGGWDADAAIGADVARHPLARGAEPIVVNGDDVARARIVQRYRLYSDQPDEMITFRALSGMNARRGKLDPKLYQYGGLWIYGVGVMLTIAKACGAIVIRHDVAYYLDRPEEFGRFYVVARIYALLGGLALVIAVYGIMRRIGLRAAWVAAVVVALMPVVINSAHEAKPHLLGAALVMFAVWSAGEYVAGGKRSTLLVAGGLCGAATGMVLWTAPAFVILPMAVVLGEPAARRTSAGSVERRGARGGLAAAIAIGIGFYACTNPYVIFHLCTHPSLLRSNLGNTSAMYGVHSTGGAIVNSAMLIVAGMSPILAIAGIASIVLLAPRLRRGSHSVAARQSLLLAAVAIVMAGPYVLLAGGKPAEYARFALVPDVALAMAAVGAIEAFGRRGAFSLAIVAILATGCFGAHYTATFVQDQGSTSSRLLSAQYLQGLTGSRLAIAAEPAPYCLPPVDLFRWQLLLLPKWDPAQANRDADASCRAVDYNPNAGAWIFATPISWAQKPFVVTGEEGLHQGYGSRQQRPK